MQELDRLNEKLDLLLKKYTSLQEENSFLKQTISQQTKSIEDLNGKLSSVEKSMVSFQADNNGSVNHQNETMRKQLDSVIAEIDQILANLND